MEQLDFLISVIGILIVVVPLFILFTNRITRLETKMDCLLSWIIEIDPTDKISTKEIHDKREEMKKRIEPLINGNGCKTK